MPQSYIGLMSGTSMDGVDAVLIETEGTRWQTARAHYFIPYTEQLRYRLLELQNSGGNELHRAALLAQELAELNAHAVISLLRQQNLPAAAITAIGAHGQTVRHAPEHGYTCQLLDLARLSQLTGIDCIGDFRSRDIAAGGQGAPLVPAFHQAVFGHLGHIVVLNLGGIANISILRPNHAPTGFDTGPGNMLADAYIQNRFGLPYDRDGVLSAQGSPINDLLSALTAHPYFETPPPKSTGRELFSLTWLAGYLKTTYSHADIIHTLNRFTADTAARAIRTYAPQSQAVFLCGGGAVNPVLRSMIADALPGIQVASTETLSLPPQWVEAAAFAWLAACRVCHRPITTSTITGATKDCILGAWHCA